MGSVYLLRHFETHSNRIGRIQGQTNEGVLTTSTLALPEGMPLQRVHILCSSLLRCQQTASQLVAQLLTNEATRTLEITVLDSLRERDYGALAGQDKAKIRAEHPDWFEGTVFRPTITPPGGESFIAFKARVEGFCTELEDLGEDNISVVVCSHLQVLRMVLCRLNHLPVEQSWMNIQFPNGKIVTATSA